MINVTKPFLPPMEEYTALLTDVWKRNWLTNNGPLVNELELQLKEYLGVNHMLYLNNGTIALQIAIKALELTGEIITTPFSYVATTSSIVWEGCTPVFVDIDPNTYNIDPALIEAAITDKTTGIIATHVYGNPCDIDAIEAIAKKHNLKVIYDGAHCFGVKYKGKSIFEYGDITTASFHATKLFHTVEGGAVFTTNAALLKRMSFLRNFGHKGDEFECVGINGKNSEMHAAMGLVNLKYVDEILAKRRKQYLFYLNEIGSLKATSQSINKHAEYNYSYFPMVFESEELTVKYMEMLNENWIYPRRYFYPSLSQLNYVAPQEMPVCDSVSKRVLCLPLFHDLTEQDQSMIMRLLKRTQNN